MKTLYCDYLVPFKENKNGNWWGAISITNHSNENTLSYLEVFDFNTGSLKKRTKIELKPLHSILISNTHKSLVGITGRIRIYLNCTEKVFAKVGNSRGTINAITWEVMEELPFPKV